MSEPINTEATRSPRLRFGNRDWVKDFANENGNYERFCASCNLPFIGHKRRFLCFLCANKNKPIS